MVEGDNKMIIKAAARLCSFSWDIHFLLIDIWIASLQFESMSYQHVYREGNRAINFLAKHGLSITQTQHVYLGYFSEFDQPVWLDKIGNNLDRRMP